MPAITLQVMERAEKRWIFGALGLALLLHLTVAGVFGWYKIKGLELPNDHGTTTGPFTIKRIEIDPSVLKSNEANPIEHLPAAEPPKSSSQFNLDPQQVQNALQAQLPNVSTPTVPEANRVIAATDLTQNIPFSESDTAKISTEISKVQPAMNSGPLASARLAQDVINAASGPDRPGTSSGAPVPGTGTSGVPGFSDLASGFKAGTPSVSNLPDPVLLRLPSDVLFDFDSAVLKPQAASLLGQAVGMIAKYPSADVQIDGYTDSFGRPDYNLTLSQQRAQAVQAWLQARVSQQGYKFRSQGHGSSDYVVSSHGTIEQQQPNRRVEILIQALKL